MYAFKLIVVFNFRLSRIFGVNLNFKNFCQQQCTKCIQDVTPCSYFSSGRDCRYSIAPPPKREFKPRRQIHIVGYKKKKLINKLPRLQHNQQGWFKLSSRCRHNVNICMYVNIKRINRIVISFWSQYNIMDVFVIYFNLSYSLIILL